MKKNIFYTMQCAEAYFCTLFNCFKTIFSKFHWENVVIKKILYYNMLLFLSLFFTANSYGQLVGNGAIKANFGVDADAYANFIGFSIEDPNLPAPPPQAGAALNTDDWFLTTVSPYPTGDGLNVINQSNAATHLTAVQADNNATFFERQSKTAADFGTDPDVYAVYAGFPAVKKGANSPYLWLDAVYGRDTNSAQSNNDASIFTATSDKNPDNPTTWNLGTGSVPQKDDIIDVMAHLRGEGPRVPPIIGDPNNPDDRPFTRLWAFAAATLRETSGSKHIDFEFFRTLLDEYEVGDTQFGNTGPVDQGGRTAFTFHTADDPNTPGTEEAGDLKVPGCIVVSIDYENGGSKPDVRIRVWMSISSFNFLLTNPTGRPFNVVPGSFESGLQTTVATAIPAGAMTEDYGYVRIQALDNDATTHIFGRVNATGSTLAPPWGTLAGEKATFYPEYQTFQHVEIGIDLTEFGLDRRGTDNPCANILGTILVKTRSCAGGNNDPFTCELKDFAGPFPFGFTIPPPEPQVHDLTLCDKGNGKADFDLNSAIDDNGGGDISFHLSQADAESGDNPLSTPYESGDDTIYVRSVLPGSLCATVVDFDITVNPNPAPSVDDEAECEGDTATFMTASLGAGFTYQWYKNDVIIGGATSNSYTTGALTLAESGDVYKVVVTDTNHSTNCTGEDSGTLTVNPLPVCDITGEQVICTGSSSTFTATAGMKSYSWTGPGGFTATTQSIDVSVAGIYEVTITNYNDCSSTCSRELTVEGCGKACTPGFWKTHPEVWDNQNDYVVDNMPGVLTNPVTPGGTFVTTTNFFTYFGISPSPSISNNASLTMLGATQLGGGNCKALARHGVSALLGAAAFPGEYPYPAGANDFQSLYNLIRNAFMSGDCGTLATILADINNLDGPFCSALSKLAQVENLTFSLKTVDDAASFEAFPVPFKDQLTIKYEFDYQSKVKIEVFNSQGALVYSMTDKDPYLNKEVILNIGSTLEQEQVYIVKLTTDRGSSTKTVMSSY